MLSLPLEKKRSNTVSALSPPKNEFSSGSSGSRMTKSRLNATTHETSHFHAVSSLNLTPYRRQICAAGGSGREERGVCVVRSRAIRCALTSRRS